MLTGFQRALFQFPFVDRLNDGHTSMVYTSNILVSNNLIAIAGSKLYGYSVTPSIFDPACNAYNGLANGSTSFAVMPDLGGPGITQTMSPLAPGDISPIALDL